MTDTPQPSPDGIILLPSSRFFVRVVPLAAEVSPSRQIELALEGRASFPVNQLYYGYLLAPRCDAALVFAAYRKRFDARQTAAWGDAAAVLPAFLSLLGATPASPTIRLWSGEGEITALAWNGADPLPVAVMARETADPADARQRVGLLAEIRARTNLPAAAVEEYSGPIRVNRRPLKGGLELGIDGGPPLTLGLSPAEREAADVRDKDFLAGRQTLQKRDAILWRSFQACAAGLALMAVGEIGLLAASARLDRVRGEVRGQGAAVQKIATAQSLSRRIEEMTERRLLPFEMLALINAARPASVQFLRTVTNGLYALEIEAQTTDAADVGQYEAALKAVPELAAVETRDLRSREGVTSFVLAIAYKPALLRQEEAP